MVKFRMESRCMAMQLALCLLLGLRLVSASLQQSKAGALFQLPFSDEEKHRPPPPAASREWRLAEPSPAKAKRRGHARPGARATRAAGRDGSAGAAKRSLRAQGESQVCDTDADGNQKREADLAAACGSKVAGDFGHANAAKQSTMMNSPESMPPLNDYEADSTPSGDTGSGGDGDNRAWSNRKHANPAPYHSSDAAGSSSSSSPDAAAPIVSLPDTDPGAPSDTTPNTNVSLDPNQTLSSDSNSTSPAPSTQPGPVAAPGSAPHAQQRTVAIAAGVTVPVVALGLVALLVLHRQRRRRKEMQQARLLGGSDEETAHTPHTPATLLGTPQLLVKEMPQHELEGPPLGELEAGSTPPPAGDSHMLETQASERVVQEQEVSALTQPEEASGPSHSHSSVSATALSASVSSCSARLGRSISGPMHRSAGSGVTRNRSLKRKPVPALLETDEAETTTIQPAAAVSTAIVTATAADTIPARTQPSPSS